MPNPVSHPQSQAMGHGFHQMSSVQEPATLYNTVIHPRQWMKKNSAETRRQHPGLCLNLGLVHVHEKEKEEKDPYRVGKKSCCLSHLHCVFTTCTFTQLQIHGASVNGE